VSSLRVARMRPRGTVPAPKRSASPPSISGMTVTPVSKPLMPSASRGNVIPATIRIVVQSPRGATSPDHCDSNSGRRTISSAARATTTRFNARCGRPTSVATPIASRKPRRKTTARTAMSRSVTAMPWSARCGCSSGFSIACCAASAAESMTVITKSVAAKPSRPRTVTFPIQPGSRSSSIAMEPWPAYERAATCEYVGRAPRSVTPRSKSAAIGESAPAARSGFDGASRPRSSTAGPRSGSRGPA